MAKPVFYDPQLKRWRNLRLLLRLSGLVITLVAAVFMYTALRSEALPQTIWPEIKRAYKPVRDTKKHAGAAHGSHRKTKKPPSQVPLNEDEGLRAAFYVTWDKGSYSSLKEYLRQIDLLYPEWLHVLTPDGRMQGSDALTNEMFDVVSGTSIHQVDDQVMPLIRQTKADVEVFPLVNNFDPVSGKWLHNVGDFFDNADGRANFRHNCSLFSLPTPSSRAFPSTLRTFPAPLSPASTR